jgi:hypothetical protein
MERSDPKIKAVVPAVVHVVKRVEISTQRTGTFSEKLALALGIEPVKAPGPIQTLFNRYKKHLDGRIVCTPLPEQVHLLAENFLYWIKLEYPNLAEPGKWISARAGIVLPMLEEGTFDETGFRIDESRARALFNITQLLASPNCIHKNLRNHQHRGQGGIKGDHMYVTYHGRRTRKVAFTRFDPKLRKVILVSSFGVSGGWVAKCADMPAVHTKQGCICTCK